MGSSDLHIIALGLVAVVPMAAAFVRFTRGNLHATRHLSTRRAFPGTRIRVDVEVHNRGRTHTSFLLLEDRLPPELGAPARTVVSGIPHRGRRSVAYEVTARSRGRYRLGPLTASLTDPFDLARHRVRFSATHELLVYPEVEDLEVAPLSAPAGSAGESSSRQVFRTGEEFYMMRPYEIGDDLRRIHWPSTARIGDLMIRQDETARRATAVLLLDTRTVALGAGRDAFERAVSAAASIGTLYFRMGFTVRLATPDLAPQQLSQEQLLEALAVVTSSRARTLTPALRQVGALAAGSPSLAMVTHAPDAAEVAAICRSTSGFASKLAVLVYPREPQAGVRGTDLDRRVEGARASLAREGWDVLVLRPHGTLRGIWRLRTKRPARGTAAFS